MPLIETGSGFAQVTLVVGCHKQEKFVNDAITSAYNQDFSEMFEVVVFHDRCAPNRLGSTPGNAAIARNKIIRLLWNRTYSVRFLVFLDGDDKLPSHHLQALWDARQKYIYANNPSPIDIGGCFVTCGLQFFEGCRLDRISTHATGVIPAKTFETECPATINGLFHYEDWKAVEGFDESLTVFEDWDFWLRMSRISPAIYTNATYVLKRDHFHIDGTKIPFEHRLDAFNQKHGLAAKPPRTVPLEVKPSEVGTFYF